MANQPLPPVTSGPINAVPCPHCGKPNNFKGHDEMIAQNGVFSCDHCRQPMQAVRVQLVKVVSMRKPVGRVTAIKKG